MNGLLYTSQKGALGGDNGFVQLKVQVDKKQNLCFSIITSALQHVCFVCTKASKFIISTAQPIGFGLNHAKSMAICPSGPAPRGNASVKTEP